MKRFVLALLPLLACKPAAPQERYGFVTRLGNDTIALASVTRDGNELTSDAVDRFPRVRRRHTEIELAPDGRIVRLTMDIHTPSEPSAQRERWVVADVTGDSVRITKKDDRGTVVRALHRPGVRPVPTAWRYRAHPPRQPRRDHARLARRHGGSRIRFRLPDAQRFGSENRLPGPWPRAARQRDPAGPRLAHRRERRDRVHDVLRHHARRPPVPAGSDTLWTIPRATGIELVVNRQTGQWGSGYGAAHDLGRVPMRSDSAATPTEQFTISIEPGTAQRGTLAMAWGAFHWTVPIEVR